MGTETSANVAVDADIGKVKAKLVKKAARRGISENFGRAEVRALEDKYVMHVCAGDGVWAKIMAFYDWCMTYTDQE